jgi:hypothetical protein
MNYTAATSDSGRMTFDIEVRLAAPAQREVVRGVPVQARYDSLPNDVGTFKIGPWFPSTARLVDDVTGAPITGARVQYARVSGVSVSPSPFQTQSQADGTIRLSPTPQEPGEVVGNLSVSAGAPYRDTVIANVRLQTTQDDTLRSIGTYRLKRGP